MHIYKLIIGFKVKQTDIEKCYNLSLRIFLNGATMIKGIHFQESYSPVVYTSTLLLIIEIGVDNNHYSLPGNIMNTFQQMINIKK